jgi:hypothetical protein
VLKVFNQGLLKEDPARELEKCSKFEHLSPWLTRDEALTEILTHPNIGILGKHRGKSEGMALKSLQKAGPLFPQLFRQKMICLTIHLWRRVPQVWKQRKAPLMKGS